MDSFTREDLDDIDGTLGIQHATCDCEVLGEISAQDGSAIVHIDKCDCYKSLQTENTELKGKLERAVTEIDTGIITLRLILRSVNMALTSFDKITINSKINRFNKFLESLKTPGV